MASASIPETDLAHIQKWCRDKVPAEHAHQIRVVANVDGRHVVIAEERSPSYGGAEGTWDSHPLARLTYVTSRREWNLAVSTDADRFRRYAPWPTGSLKSLLDEIDDDPTNIFWG